MAQLSKEPSGRTKPGLKWLGLLGIAALYLLPILFKPTYSGPGGHSGLCYQHGRLSSQCDSTQSGDCVSGICVVHQ